ncbi:hypothetical protein BGZ95_007854 [Linnemannia exigua]|uniref:Uncharacterized protein n=1 Tax=Linnemannia exigua TaxID=604196 RepID=A0AAD4H8S8_9FUNG|nr:hypothetical protein BGZ95_007854 [Linnemannia exigua]
MATDDQPTPATYFQAFRSERDKEDILIPVVRHPTLGDLFVIWSDITDCFPGTIRIQYKNVYIPMLRDARCYRVKPHGIRYHPDIVLDVVYGDRVAAKRYIKSNSRDSTSNSNSKEIINSSEGETLGIGAGVGGTHGTVDSTLLDSANLAKETPLTGESLTAAIFHPPKALAVDDNNGNKDGGDLSGENDELENDEEYYEVGKQESDSESVTAESWNGSEETAIKPTEPAIREDANGGLVDTSPALPELEPREDTPETPPLKDSPTTPPPATKPAMELLTAGVATLTAGTKSVSIAEKKSALASIFELYKGALPYKRLSQGGQLGILDLVEHRVKDILDSRLTWSQSKHSKYFCFLPILTEDDSDSEPSTPTLEVPPELQNQITAVSTTTTATKTKITRAVSTTIAASATTASTTAAMSTTAATSTVAAGPALVDIQEVGPDTRFHLYYICDCGDIPGFEDRWYPHWNIKDGECHHLQAAGESLGHQQLEALLPFVGEYVMGVLDMLKFGVYTDNTVRFPAQMGVESQQRISLAIKFFESKGVISSEKYMAELKLKYKDAIPKSALDGLTPIAPLDVKSSSEFRRRIVKHRWEKYDEMNPYRTTEGDVRWVCLAHWYDMSPQDDWVVANKFCKNPASIKSAFKTAQGSFSSEIHTIQRAREFFDLAKRLTTTSVFRISLTWELMPEDEKEIAQAVCQLQAAALHLTVRKGTGMQDGAASGFDLGFLYLIMSSLKNPFLEVFRLMQSANKDNTKYPVNDERFNVSSSTFSPDTLALWTRPTRDQKVKAILRVTHIDQAAISVRGLSKGFQCFSELRLLAETAWKEVTIKFTDASSGVPGSDIKDVETDSMDLFRFFMQRDFCDKVAFYCGDKIESQFLYSTCLTHVRLGVSLTEDRTKIRNMIKMNTSLKSLQLENPDKDDPSQIYESCKAVMASHPSLELFEIRHLHRCGAPPSTFTWVNPNDSAKMRVRITCFEGDKIQAMFQKYAPLIEHLRIQQLQPSDSAILEKSMRAKKGPMALRRLQIQHVHLMEPAVLEDVRKIIVRSDIQVVDVTGDVLQKRSPPDHETDAAALEITDRRVAKNGGNAGKNGGNNNNSKYKDKDGDVAANVEVWVDFLLGIRSKITGIHLWGKGMSKLLDALGTRIREALDMPVLHELTLTGQWEKSLLENDWLRVVMHLKQPRDRANSIIYTDTPSKLLTVFHVSGVVITRDDWHQILCLLDYTQMVQFQIEQTNQLLPELYADILSVLPEDSPTLNQFTVDDDRSLDAEEVLQYENAVRARTSKYPILVMINGYALT